MIVACEHKNRVLSPNDHTDAAVVETFITYDDLFRGVGPGGPDRVQDFDLNTSQLFVHPTGAYGIYLYDLNAQTLRRLTDYTLGEYIAQDSIYVFYEVSGYAILRYNLLKDSTDLFGIYLTPEGKPRLSWFSLSTRTFLEDKPFPTAHWEGMRIFKDRFYFADYNKRQIDFLDVQNIS